MGKILVSDIHKFFGSKIHTLSLDTTLEEILKIFASETSLSGVCLLDQNQKYAGMVTKRDILKWAHLQFAEGHGIHNISIAEFYRDHRCAQGERPARECRERLSS